MPRACVRSSPMSLSVLCHHLDSLVNLALRNEVDLVLDEHHRDVAALVLHLQDQQDQQEEQDQHNQQDQQDRRNCVNSISISISIIYKTTKTGVIVERSSALEAQIVSALVDCILSPPPESQKAKTFRIARFLSQKLSG